MQLAWDWLSMYWLPIVLHGGMLCAVGYVYTKRYELLITNEEPLDESR